MYDRAVDSDPSRIPLALAAGLVAALMAGLAWAAIVLSFDVELGWAAWGVGALVGLAMCATTAYRSRGLAVAAATLAFVGLLAGKVFVVAWSAGGLAEEVGAEPEYMESAVAWRMYSEGTLAPATLEALERTRESGDTLSDALWADMRAQAATHLAGLPAADREAVAEAIARDMIREVGLLGGVRAQLSGFDLLWLVLALATAFQMLDRRKEEVAEPPIPAGMG
jgi:hypothetical protein